MNKNITIVTGLWDLGRNELDSWAKRDFDTYKKHFYELLKVDVNMVIWIPKSIENEVRAIRDDHNTRIYIKEVEDFKTWFPFFDNLQKIRTNPNWYNSAGWLSGSPQAQLEYYNPILMSKMFMLHDSMILNPLNSEYFFWIDGGITSTVNSSLLKNENILDNLEVYCELTEKFTFITYPYTSNNEIHGFERTKMAEYCNVDFVDKVSRGGFFGGNKKLLSTINDLYYNILETTINNGYMGADECLFTILSYRHQDIISTFEVESNGLIQPFFEKLRTVNNTEKKIFSRLKTSLYVLTYNSPNQFKKLLESFEKVDSDFLKIPTKILVNNSTDNSTFDEYNKLCEKYGFEIFNFDNIGICGGRQWVAEHFDKSDSDYYIFFEDDMFLHEMTDQTCRFNLNRYVKNLFHKSLKIIYENDYDFLKLSFSEFYGDNSVQWAWYNISQDVREKYFPQKMNLPVKGLDSNPPKTIFTHIKKFEDLNYIEGEVHYCNWPLWFSKKGNKKVFINQKYKYLFEQTWMSEVFNLYKNGRIKSGVLMLSPINHDRFDFYPKEERREN